MFSFSLGSPHFVHGNYYNKAYIIEVEKQNKFYEKTNCAKSLYIYDRRMYIDTVDGDVSGR